MASPGSHALEVDSNVSVSQGLSREGTVRDQETTAHIEAEVLPAHTTSGGESLPGGESLIWVLPELCHEPDHDPDVTPGEPKDAVQSPEACLVSSVPGYSESQPWH